MKPFPESAILNATGDSRRSFYIAGDTEFLQTIEHDIPVIQGKL